MSDSQAEKEFSTPQHQARVKAAQDREQKRKQGPAKVVRQWIEIHKRVPNEIGKVLLKTTTETGATHSWYVGRETKAREWIAQQIKEGVEVWDGPRDGGQGRKYVQKKGA